MTNCRPGSVQDLGPILAGLRPSAVMLFTGGESFRRSGAASAIEPMLARISVERVSDVAPNPTLERVEDAVDAFRQSSPEAIVAVGGGSVLDLAKATRGLAGEVDLRASVLSATATVPANAPLVAIPTTAGTGSEATHFAVVYVDGVKHSVGSPSWRPDHVVLDPDLTASMPARVTAETGLDALSQAMESLWSTRSTHESLDLARRALELAWSNLEPAVKSPSPETRSAMCEAAHLAGRAIDVSRTTAAHALSYPITVDYGVAHGHAVALTLGALLEYNSAVSDDDCVDARGADFVRARVRDVLDVLDAADGTAGRHALTALVQSVGLETTLSAVGASSPSARQAIVDRVDADRQANNPRALDAEALARIVESIA
jgi:alcohol dehydrogenase class IV